MPWCTWTLLLAAAALPAPAGTPPPPPASVNLDASHAVPVSLGRGWTVRVPSAWHRADSGLVRARGEQPGVRARFSVLVVETPPGPPAEGTREPPATPDYSTLQEPSPEPAWVDEGLGDNTPWSTPEPLHAAGVTWSRQSGAAPPAAVSPERHGPPPGPCGLCLAGGMCCASPCTRSGLAPLACGVTLAFLPCLCCATGEHTCLGLVWPSRSSPPPAPQTSVPVPLASLSLRLGPQVVYLVAENQGATGELPVLQGLLEAVAGTLEHAGPTADLRPLELCAAAPLACQSPSPDSPEPALACLPDADGTARCLRPAAPPEIRSY